MPPWEKYQQAAPAGPWSKYAQPAAEMTLTEAAFPSTKDPQPSTQIPNAFAPPAGDPRATMELLSLPTRLAGALGGALGYQGATGGKSGKEAVADPETGLMRPAREALGKSIGNHWSGSDEGKRTLGDYGAMAAAGAGYLASSVAEDPAVLLGGIAKAGGRAIDKLAGKATGSVTGKIARAAEMGANKVQNTIIRPRAMDEAAGFKIENVSKYGVDGSIEEVIGKSQSKIEDAAKNLKVLIKEGKDGGARVNLNEAVAEVEKEIRQGRAKEFANLKESPKALKDLRERIALLAEDAPGGNADLVDAQYVKQALGDMGAFEHIAGKQGVQISKDDRALSQMASRVYLKVKDKIEKVAPEGVKEQNRIMSDLIPVNRAALYRKLVADRNNVVSMSDMLGAMATIGGGPKGLALWAASKASKSGNTAKALYSAARALKSARAPGEAEFYSNALQRLGATAAEIETIRGATEAAGAGQSNIIPFRKVAQDSTMNQPQAMR